MMTPTETGPSDELEFVSASDMCLLSLSPEDPNESLEYGPGIARIQRTCLSLLLFSDRLAVIVGLRIGFSTHGCDGMARCGKDGYGLRAACVFCSSGDFSPRMREIATAASSSPASRNRM